MKEFEYTLTDPEGIHARPAGLLVKEAKKYDSKISIFTVMGLGAKHGETIRIQVEGPDEEAAAKAVDAFLKANM